MLEINSLAEKKNFYKTVLALVLPMALQNLINVGVQAADVVMLGKVGEIAISASSLAGQVYFVMTLFFFGLTSGAAVLISQYWGKKDIKTIEKVFGIALAFAFATAIIFTVAAIFFPTSVMHIFSNEDEVIKQGAEYMRIIAISYIPSAITMVYLNVMRSVECVVVATVVFSASLAVNVILNAILIFGLLGFPAMGVKGAAIATAMARYVELIIVIFYDVRINKTVKIKIKNIFKFDKLLLSDFITYALPVTANELIWGCGISAINAIIGHLGSSAVAANSVAQVVRQLAMVVTFGVASATAIMLGKTIGEGKSDWAKVYAKRFVIMTLLLGIIGGLLVIIISPLVVNFLSLGAEAGDYLRKMLMIMAYFIIACGINTTLIVGVFRAGGDTKIGLVLDCGIMWGVAILFGAVAAFLLKLPVIAVYVILTCDELVKLPFSLKRYKSKKWLKDVTRNFD